MSNPRASYTHYPTHTKSCWRLDGPVNLVNDGIARGQRRELPAASASVAWSVLWNPICLEVLGLWCSWTSGFELMEDPPVPARRGSSERSLENNRLAISSAAFKRCMGPPEPAAEAPGDSP